MSRGNDVFQVLIPTVAPSLIAAPAALASLAEGAIGFYSYPDNDPIDPTGTLPAKFYAAVGIKNLDGVADINKSAGTHIQAKNVVEVTNQPYVAATDQSWDITLESLKCGVEYGIRIEIRNQEAYRLNGYNQVMKTYMAEPEDCDTCTGDCERDCVAVAEDLAAQINADEDGLYTATTSGTICGTDVKLVITAKAATIKDFCSVNLNYFSPNQTVLIATPIGIAKTTVDSGVEFEQGSGVDVKQLEYEAGGWNGKPGPYRVSELNGVAREGFQYFADASADYEINHVSYNQDSISGWRGDSAFVRTIFAAESGTVADAVKSLLALMFPNA